MAAPSNWLYFCTLTRAFDTLWLAFILDMPTILACSRGLFALKPAFVMLVGRLSSMVVRSVGRSGRLGSVHAVYVAVAKQLLDVPYMFVHFVRGCRDVAYVTCNI